MKKITGISLLLVSIIALSSCTGSEQPLTEAQQAEQYNMTVGEYKEVKDAAARMNMTVEDHLKMSDMDHSSMGTMDMPDDSSMIEDDADMMNMEAEMETEVKMDMNDEDEHMNEMHKGEDMADHNSSEHR